MRILTASLVAVALLASGCGRKKLAETPAATAAAAQAGADGSGGGGAGLPGSQADLVARAGSDTIYFNTDRFELDAANRATLDAQAAWLAANPNVRVTVEGHADERGTREYNLALGDRRAYAA